LEVAVRLRRVLAGCVFVSLCASSADAALIDLGNAMIYDTVQDLTWIQDLNYVRTSGADADGRLTYDQAEAWVEGLVFGSYDDWRLPRMHTLGLHSSNDEVSLLMEQLGGHWEPTEEGVAFPNDYVMPVSMSPFTGLWSYIWVAPPVGATPCLPSLEHCFSWMGWTTIDQSAYHWDRHEPGPSAWAVRDGGNPYARVPEPGTLFLVGMGAAAHWLARRRTHPAAASTV
jgi:hypothetical protein